jgi:predicted HTH transcriptional regulator
VSLASAEEVNPDFEFATSKALAIARGVGRVTNTSLRELVPITSGEAREVLQSLVRDGLLASRGVRRGTYYILAESASGVDRARPPAPTPLSSPEAEKQDWVK